MARKYDPLKTYRPHVEYCPQCVAAAKELSKYDFPIFFFEPTTRKCWNNCGNNIRCLNITSDERDIIMHATDWSVKELERMATLKETNPRAFRKQLKEWSLIPNVDSCLNSKPRVKRCDWCIEHNIVDPKNKHYCYFSNYYNYSLGNTKKCTTCGKELSILNTTYDELFVWHHLLEDDVSLLNAMLKLRDEDINKYYWEIGTMEAKRRGIRYPGEPIPIENIIVAIPYGIIALIKALFFTWPHSIWAWLIVLGILIAWGGGS